MMSAIDTTETKDSKKTVYEQFFNDISNLFDNVYNETWMNTKSLESAKLSEEEKKVEL